MRKAPDVNLLLHRHAHTHVHAHLHMCVSTHTHTHTGFSAVNRDLGGALDTVAMDPKNQSIGDRALQATGCKTKNSFAFWPHCPHLDSAGTLGDVAQELPTNVSLRRTEAEVLDKSSSIPKSPCVPLRSIARETRGHFVSHLSHHPEWEHPGPGGKEQNRAAIGEGSLAAMDCRDNYLFQKA